METTSDIVFTAINGLIIVVTIAYFTLPQFKAWRR